MAEESPKQEAKSYTVPESFLFDPILKNAERGAGNKPRALSFDNDKQRNARNLSKGLAKPGYIGFETLKRASKSVHIASICKTTMKEKITKTKWVIRPVDPLVDAKTLKKKIDAVASLLKKPNTEGDTWRSFIDKSVDDLLVYDGVFWEKTRYPDGELAELYHVDYSSIHPVFNEYGQTNIELSLDTTEGEKVLPVAYLQVLNYSQYGGPESGDITAAWSLDDAIRFHLHPQGSLDGFGFGLSPLEAVLSVVTNLLNADNYNGTYFEEGGFPPVILQLVGQMNERDLERYREYLLTELQGHFHRPAIMAGQAEAKVINLKDLTNNDMQFMEYQLWLAKLMCAAYGMSPQDIGLTDQVGNKDVSKEQKDSSESKGYGSILSLLKEQVNLIIEEDFQFDDIEFDWIADDTMNETEISTVVDQRLKNGSMTINEAREKFGNKPFGTWANEATLLTTNGFQMLGADQIQDPVEVAQQAQENQEAALEAKKGGDDTEEKKPFGKSVYTQNYKCYFDDRGYSQPFIYMDMVTNKGKVIKPPVAVNLMSQETEVRVSREIAGKGINVPLVTKMSYTDIVQMLPAEVRQQFERYVVMTQDYDSEKWRAKFGGSRRYPYYLVQEFINGYPLTNKVLIDDMTRDPFSYHDAVKDLADIWQVEKNMKLGDRRADQYIISMDKRGWGFDYQFKGDVGRWERTKDSLPDVLKAIPELYDIFKKETSITKSIINSFRKRQ